MEIMISTKIVWVLALTFALAMRTKMAQWLKGIITDNFDDMTDSDCAFSIIGWMCVIIVVVQILDNIGLVS